MSTSPQQLAAAVDTLFTNGAAPWDQLLERVLAHFQCPVGTVHLLEKDGLLHLKAHRGLPAPMLAKVDRIPMGKGMAGIAAERRSPVQVCNLQTDDSGVVRPGAKDTKMEGSLAAPMLAAGQLFGVLGIAKPTPYEFTDTETALLVEVGARAALAARPKVS